MRRIHFAMTLTMLASGLSGLPSLAAAGAAPAGTAAPTPVPRQTPQAAPLPVDETAAASHWAMPTITLPAPGASTVAVSSSSVATAGVLRVAAPAALGTLGLPALPAANQPQPDHMQPPVGDPVWPASATSPPASVTVDTLGASARAAMHDAPMVFQVARADGGAGAGPVAVSIDYSGFRDAYGGNYADRLELVRYPSCVLTVPDDPSCSVGTLVANQLNDPSTTTMTAVVDADAAAAAVSPDATAAVASPTDSTSASPTDSTAPISSGGTGSVFVVQAAPSSPSGSFIASPLSASANWSVGLESGSFDYSYPIGVPAPMGGSSPRVALDYDSGSIDGRTSSSNPQASMFGMGWDYQPGFVEREYDSCDREGGSYPDDCYVSTHQNVTLSLNGRSMHLIVDSTTGSWRLQDDPGWIVVHGTGAANGDKTGEFWKLQSPDGTIYYFGRGVGRKPANSNPPPTNSTWTLPVWNWDSTCLPTLPTACTKGWRWNLDYVIDRNSNAIAYYYGSEGNAYKAHNGATATQYVRGGHIVSITYGYKDNDPGTTTTPVDEVLFTTVGRCVQNADGGTNTCPIMNTANATSYPDVPVDQVCATGATNCTNTSPTFFDDSMVSVVTTQVLSSGTTYVPLDKYQLQLDFPDPDGTGSESPTLWLSQVTHTGLATTPNVSLPPMILFGTALPNRADTVPGVSGVVQYRVGELFNESGGELAVNYDTPDGCDVNMADHSKNTDDCFPVHWVPKGSTTWAAGWFYKYLVTRVGQYVNYAHETPGASPASPQLTAEPMVTDYAYSGGAAWHKNEFQLNASDTDTWNEYRGYQTVSVTEDEVDDGVISTTASRSVTVHKFFRGMYGDPYLPGDTPATNTDTVTTADFGSTADSAWLQGREAETIVETQGGTLMQRTDTNYWTSQTASMASVGGDPAEVAEEVQPYTVLVDTPKANGAIRQHEAVDVHYNAGTSTNILNGAIVTHVDVGDTSMNPDPEANCTTMSYTSESTRYIMELQLKETVSGVAGANGCPGTGMLSESRYYYDGAHALNNGGANPGNVPSNGNLTCTREYLASGASGDCPATQVISTLVADTYVAYDGYGRVTSTKDGNGHTSTVAYSPSTGRPTSVAQSSPPISKPAPAPAVTLTSTTSIDYRGMPTQVTDPNGNVTKEVYDALGRLIKAYAPTEAALLPGTDIPTFIANYDAQRATWSTVETEHLIDISGTTGHYQDTWTYLDGWLRTREVHTVPFGGAGHLTVETRYNDIGAASATTSPYWGNTGVHYGMDYTSPNDVPLETRFSYDALHRQTIAARTVNGAQSWGNTVTSYAADQTVTTPPFPEPIVTATIDAWGRSLVSREDSQNDLNHSQLNYGYDPLGRVTSVADDAGHTDSYVYDLGGRRTSSTDADAGTTATEYDAVGNATKTTDAYGVAVSTTYDEINRPLAASTLGHSSAPTFPGGQLAGYTYDSSTTTHGLGLLATSTVYDLGNTGNAWTTTVSSYDADGRPLSQTSAIPAVSGLSGTTNYTVSTSYLADGSPASVSYPAIGDLPSETATVAYEDTGGATGLPVSLTGPVTTNATYNQLGQLSQRTFGSTANPGYTVRQYTYGDPLERLSEIRTDSVPVNYPVTVQDDLYSYDNADNVTDIIDGTGVDQQTCFSYDGLDRLIKAWTRHEVTDHCATYDSTAAVGPAGFNQLFTYANDGAPATRSDLGGAAMSFTAAATGHPHAISAFNGNTYGYDAAGRESSRTVGGVTTTMSWDPLNHLYQSATATAVTAYVNNTDGSRIARTDPDGSTTLWVGPDELHVAAGAITGTRYYTLGGTTIAMKNASGLRWLSNDTQDSRQLAINANTGAVTRTYYTPYGAQRDGAATLPTDQGFLGHVVDQGTGLVQDGARYYDPSIGQFLTPDPLANAADNKALDPYGYAGNNPIALADPSGLWFPAPDGTVDNAQDTIEPPDTDPWQAPKIAFGVVAFFGIAGVGVVNGVKDATVNPAIDLINLGIDGVQQDVNNVLNVGNWIGGGRYEDYVDMPHIPHVPSIPIHVKGADLPLALGHAGGVGGSLLLPAGAMRTLEALSALRGAGAIADSAALEGATDYQVFDPANPGRTITDIDRIENGTLWEEKSAASAQNPESWIEKQLIAKFNRYVEARQYLPGYEDAPIGFDFTSPNMDPAFRSQIVGAIERLRLANPGIQIVTRFGP